MASALSLLQQYSQSALARLPPPAQELLLHPLTQKAAGALLALGLVRSVNNRLTQWTMNNWTSAGRWTPSREIVLVSGGCSGIGKQVVEDLAKIGVQVVILDINEPNFPLPANVRFYHASVTSSESIAAAAATIRKEVGDPTVLINNAGVAFDQTILDEPEEKIRLTFEVNTVSHFLMVREFLPAMIRANHGHVITVASMASFVALGEMADYCGSKASALAFHESLRQELRYWYNAPKVRTSIIHPMWVRTPMIKMLTDHESKFGQPIMTVQKVSDAIVHQIVSQNSGQVVLPASKSVARLVRAMPTWMQETVRSIEAGKLYRMRLAQKAEEEQGKH
ncbi:hypothetical protein N7468_000055 [Penicillium chermesinum]|uniref:Short-chain dehydrogenase/reductase 3 n=1 Tax=Penicillium chermesinum TaxID=63820 RepID=A0A9W9PML4_9EURO|nr:uncharacterized protein N7468_000055 [Penicillium chermesinum]KAJ5248604.1 hypothetical protein N7468_000055 [Penicillium chermesinum]KAJ6150719.1 hypothetical protein N7470_007313 [Penicillium chermesinum]